MLKKRSTKKSRIKNKLFKMCDLLKKSRDIVIPPMLLKSIKEKKIFFETYTNSEQKILFSFFNNNDKYLILIALLLSSND